MTVDDALLDGTVTYVSHVFVGCRQNCKLLTEFDAMRGIPRCLGCKRENAIVHDNLSTAQAARLAMKIRICGISTDFMVMVPFALKVFEILQSVDINCSGTLLDEDGTAQHEEPRQSTPGALRICLLSMRGYILDELAIPLQALGPILSVQKCDVGMLPFLWFIVVPGSRPEGVENRSQLFLQAWTRKIVREVRKYHFHTISGLGFGTVGSIAGEAISQPVTSDIVSPQHRITFVGIELPPCAMAVVAVHTK